MRRIIVLLIPGLLLLCFCTPQQKAPKVDYAKEGYVKAQVIRYDVDGCGYLIELEDSDKTKLAPGNLPDELEKHGQKIWIKYTLVKKPLMSTCMAGKQVDVLDIRAR